jgi:hypothetical protein
LREFAPTGAGNAVPTLKDARKEAFVPENVYDAMKENKRFDSMRVSLAIRSGLTVADLGIAWIPRRRRRVPWILP